jgi:hypothetical protein
MTAAECHQFAKECLASAEQAQTAELRKTFLELADAWLQAAARLDGIVLPDAPDDLTRQLH